MIIDRENVFSSVQAITVTANSTDVIDFATARNIARGVPVRCRIQVDTTFTAAGAATLTAALVSSAAAALSSPTTLLTTAAIPVATLVAGYIILDAVVPFTEHRYVGVIYTVATGPMTAGALSAMLLMDTETPVDNSARGAIRRTGVTGF